MAFSFGTPVPKLNLGGTTNSNSNTLGSIFGSKPNQSTQGSNLAQSNTNTTQPAGTSTTFSNPQIDIAHLRSTTKFDHLTPDLQSEISALDTAILNQIRQCSEVSDLIPAVISSGTQTAPAIDFVTTKLEELETGLENDAEGIVNLRDGILKRDEGEAKCVFKAVDRLKVPRQYQVGHTVDVGANGAAFGGVGSGLSGWWNSSSTLRGSSIRANGAGGQSVQLVDEGLDDDTAGPANLVDLFNERTKQMGELQLQQEQLLSEIEDFVEGLESKISLKEREVSEKLEFGTNGSNGLQEEREHQMRLLRFVFGEVQRNLYEVAEKVGSTRDGVVDLGLRRS